MWDCALTKKVKQGHVSDRESVSVLAKCGCLGGSGSLIRSLLKLFSFKQVCNDLVYIILLLHGHNATNHPNPILLFSTVHAVSCNKYSLNITLIWW